MSEISRTLSNVDPALRHCWHPVTRCAEVTETPRRAVLLARPEAADEEVAATVALQAVAR